MNGGEQGATVLRGRWTSSVPAWRQVVGAARLFHWTWRADGRWLTACGLTITEHMAQPWKDDRRINCCRACGQTKDDAR